MLAQDQGLQARHQRDLLKCGGVQLRTVKRDLLNSNQPGKGQSISVSDRDIHQGNGEDVGIPKAAAAEFFYSRQDSLVLSTLPQTGQAQTPDSAWYREARVPSRRTTAWARVRFDVRVSHHSTSHPRVFIDCAAQRSCSK